MVHVNFVSIRKLVGQNNNITFHLGHRNDFDQSNKSSSTRDMRTAHYAVMLSGTVRRPLIHVWIGESLSLVYAQKGNSTEVQIYRTVSDVTRRNMIFRKSN
jgi:hypothetical protein